MTLALGFASRAAIGGDPATKTGTYVMADSRLTIEGPARDRYLDNYLKAVSLGTRSAAVAAGSVTPFVLAIEGARPFIAWNAADRANRGMSPLSLWAEASFVRFHLELMFDEFRTTFADARVNEVTIICAGVFSDGTPGLVRLDRRESQNGNSCESHRAIDVWRPRPGQRVYTVAGTPAYVPILEEAIRRSEPPTGNAFYDVASTLWDIIKHQGDPTRTVGGGLALGYINHGQPLFQWPIIEVDGHVFSRALQYPMNLGTGWPRPMKIHYNPMIFAEIERAHEDGKIASSSPPPDLRFEVTRSWDIRSTTVGELAVGDPRLIVIGQEDQWLLDALDA
ncbi:MAG: hypothetical protein E6J90_15995 [Deltaproteobacteria bacterium]|nr:MAG: hypothetical protein E6J90_15995 [Deltaproteobacteria bacterium]